MSKYEFKGTPGPWMAAAGYSKWAGVSDIYEIHWSNDGECVAEIVHGKTDAQAISAVPELIEALDQSLTALLDSGYAPDSVVVIAARSALAKATGEHTGGES